jgi:hypothetical protein
MSEFPSKRPLSIEDVAALYKRGSQSEAIVRLDGDMGGGDSSPHNYGLWCQGCGAMLGRLGVFTERLDASSGRMLRKAHCPSCHATSVCDESRVTLMRPAVAVNGSCLLCHSDIDVTPELLVPA